MFHSHLWKSMEKSMVVDRWYSVKNFLKISGYSRTKPVRETTKAGNFTIKGPIIGAFLIVLMKINRIIVLRLILKLLFKPNFLPANHQRWNNTMTSVNVISTLIQRRFFHVDWSMKINIERNLILGWFHKQLFPYIMMLEKLESLY